VPRNLWVCQRFPEYMDKTGSIENYTENTHEPLH
jgi:hypothetical protein